MNVKEFSRIVCVSLFSYQGFCLATAFILYHIFPHLSISFFKFFEVFFQTFMWFSVVSVVSCDSLFTISSFQIFVNSLFYFSEINLNCLNFRSSSLRQLVYFTTFIIMCQPLFLFFYKILKKRLQTLWGSSRSETPPPLSLLFPRQLYTRERLKS